MNFKSFKPKHFNWALNDGVARISLDRPDRKNPLTFDSYAELRDTFRDLVYAKDVKAVVFGSNGGNFCSGGDVHDIIGPLTKMSMPELLDFTRMTGDLVKAMRNCPQPIIAAVDGVSVGAGAIISMASDIRYAAPEAKTAFLFNRVGLAGCDMGACAMLPRIRPMILWLSATNRSVIVALVISSPVSMKKGMAVSGTESMALNICPGIRISRFGSVNIR